MFTDPFIKDRNGKVFLNASMRFCKSGFIVPPEANYPTTIAAAPTAANPKISNQIILEGPEDSYSQIVRFKNATVGGSENNDADKRSTMVITETAYRRRLMNQPILCDHIATTALMVNDLVEPLYLAPQQIMLLEYQNNTLVNTATRRVIAEAMQVQQPIWRRQDVAKYIQDSKDRTKQLYPYWLTTDATVNIAARESATVPSNKTVFFTVSKDIRLVIFGQRLTALSSGGDVATNALSPRIELFDAPSGRPLQNQSIPQICAAGLYQGATAPSWFACGWVLEPNTVVKAVLYNTYTAALDFYYTFYGVAQYMG